MPDLTSVALVAGLIAWTYIVHAFVLWLLPVDWWPTGSPPEEDDDADIHE